ncbi:hypothetical protein I4F81_012036 [Pyropia yezoensis]|uniref:Uncharacterized protein n=1 Tax=Pyropia yezoensis TaxID=2788 RepID=A0ACC3CIL4_PYRYE|nr:hypothetical protein I4F81_012036 [Neopyropia yezoensis]
MANAFDAFWASAQPLAIPAASLAALPEYALLRRLPAAAAWLAPYSPFVTAAAAAAVPPPPPVGPEHLAASVAMDFSHCSSVGGRADGAMGGGGVAGGVGGVGPAPAAAAVVGDDGSHGDGGGGGVDGGGSDVTLMLMATLLIPMRVEGPLVCGVTVSDALISDRVRQVHSPGKLFDDGFLFVCDTSNTEYLLWGCSADGAVVEMERFILSENGNGNAEILWLSSVVRRPAVAGAPPTLLLRTSTLLHRTAPWTRELPPLGVPPMAAFRMMMEEFGAFGAASVLMPPVEAGGAGGGNAAGVFPWGAEGDWGQGLAAADGAPILGNPPLFPTGGADGGGAAGGAAADAVAPSAMRVEP